MDKDMSEPLTIVEVPIELMRRVEQGLPYIRLPVPMNMMAWVTQLDKIPNVISTAMDIVTLKMEKIVGRRNGSERVEILYWTATPDSEELALLLRAAFLPGQLTELKRRELQSWFIGAIGGLPPS
jgi:hypothetical protein